jgi:hypothetical protein
MESRSRRLDGIALRHRRDALMRPNAHRAECGMVFSGGRGRIGAGAAHFLVAVPDHPVAAAIIRDQHFAGSPGVGAHLRQLPAFLCRILKAWKRTVGRPLEIDPPGLSTEDHEIKCLGHPTRRPKCIHAFDSTIPAEVATVFVDIPTMQKQVALSENSAKFSCRKERSTAINGPAIHPCGGRNG